MMKRSALKMPIVRAGPEHAGAEGWRTTWGKERTIDMSGARVARFSSFDANKHRTPFPELHEPTLSSLGSM